MSIYTAVFSRDLAAKEGVSNGKPAGELLQLNAGDHKGAYCSKPNMCEIFYWRTVELLETEVDEIRKALNSPHYSDLERTIITYPKKKVLLNKFNNSDKTKLRKRGDLPEKLGGELSIDSFSLVEV